jgi:hypothetical protein
MAVAIDEMSVEVAPIAPAPAHGAASGAASASGQPDPAALHKMMQVLHERKLRLKTN